VNPSVETANWKPYSPAERSGGVTAA
jgi:hypothetical protein